MKITEKMVSRFLQWRFPEDFTPDGGVAFTPPKNPHHSWPIGTNVLTAIQARAMLEHVLGAVPECGTPVAWRHRFKPTDPWQLSVGMPCDQEYAKINEIEVEPLYERKDA